MITVKDSVIQDKIEQLYMLNQEHIFRFWPDLNERQKQELLNCPH